MILCSSTFCFMETGLHAHQQELHLCSNLGRQSLVLPGAPQCVVGLMVDRESPAHTWLIPFLCKSP